jgi:hypothetical protein
MLRAQQCADGNVREMCLILFDGETLRNRMSPTDTPACRAGAQPLCAGSTDADVVGWARPVGGHAFLPIPRTAQGYWCQAHHVDEWR